MAPTGPFDGAYAGVRVLVLGAGGFIGRSVSRLLAEARAEVFLGIRVARPAAGGPVGEPVGEAVVADLAVPGAGAEVVARVRPAMVFNLAGYGVDRTERDEGLAERLNRDLPGELCRAVAALGPGQRRLVHVGSGAEYGSATGELHEDTSPRPTTVYGRTKLAGTLQVSDLCADLGVLGLIARPFTVYGPGEHPGRLLPSLLQAARSGDVVDLSAGRQRRDFTYVDDVAAGLLRLGLANAPPGTVVNLATGRLISVRAFCEVAAGILGIPHDRLRYGALPVRDDETEYLEVSVARLRQLIGWAPTTSIAAGVARTRDVERSP